MSYREWQRFVDEPITDEPMIANPIGWYTETTLI